MGQASLHHDDSKPLSAPVRRAVAWAAVLLVLALGVPGGFVAGRAAGFPQKPSAQTPQGGEPRYLAEKDVEVGQFYLKKGKYNAAISRFVSAIAHDSQWAQPHKLLGQAFEKKDDLKRAIAEYREYLKLYPDAKDAKKIEQRVKKLDQDLKEQVSGSH